jgi:hypothetical protein
VRLPNGKWFTEAQEQEIARLQDQLATARTMAIKVRGLLNSPQGYFVGSAIAELREFLGEPMRSDVMDTAAIPASDREQLLDHLAAAREALTKIADTRRMGSYVHASNVQTKFVYAQRWAAAALENLTVTTGDHERLLEQLATAREALKDAEYWWSMANTELSEVGKDLKCYDPKELAAIGKVRNTLDQLAAIPTSDRERLRLLEEAREIIDCYLNQKLYRGRAINIGAMEWLAKLGASNQP